MSIALFFAVSNRLERGITEFTSAAQFGTSVVRRFGRERFGRTKRRLSAKFERAMWALINLINDALDFDDFEEFEGKVGDGNNNCAFCRNLMEVKVKKQFCGEFLDILVRHPHFTRQRSLCLKCAMGVS